MNILEKYTENLIVKKNLLQTTVDAYKLDINEYLEFLKKRDIDILDTDEKIFNEYFSDAEKKYKKAKKYFKMIIDLGNENDPITKESQEVYRKLLQAGY